MEKKILYIGGFELPDKNAAAQRVLGNAKALRALGYDVIFLDVDRDIKDDQLSGPHDTEGFITYSQRHANDIKGLIRYSVKPLHVIEILEKYMGWEAIIAYNYPAFSLSSLRKLCKKRKIKCFADCTEWYSLDYFSLRNVLIQVDSFFRMSFFQKKLDGIICISSYLEKYYRKHTKTVVIPPLVDIEDSKWKKGIVEKHKGVRLVYSGSPGYKKDKLNEIIRILENSDDIDLLVVGISKDQYINIYPADKEAVNYLVKMKRLSFNGRVSHIDALKCVKSADYTVFYREKTRTNMAGFPTKFVESVTCGVPVITTDTSDLRKYLTNSCNGYLLDSQLFVEELLDVIQRNNGISINRTQFDYRKYSEKFKEILGN